MQRISFGLVAALGAAALAAALAFGLGGSPEPPPPGAAGARPGAAAEPALAAELRRLQHQLDAEIERRLDLERRMAVLEQDLARGAGPAQPARPARAGRHEARPAATREAVRAAALPPGHGGGGLDEAALEAAGFAPERVQELRARIDALDLARLELRNRAAREGWRGTPRFGAERAALESERESLRGDFGDELYDWMLYSGGRPNRVVVDDVMQGSAAAEAGLTSGDLILRYGDARLFGPQELRRATVQGREGETVPVEVLRGGERIRLFVPRGPLGVRVRARRMEPPPAS